MARVWAKGNLICHKDCKETIITFTLYTSNAAVMSFFIATLQNVILFPLLFSFQIFIKQPLKNKKLFTTEFINKQSFATDEPCEYICWAWKQI